MKLTEAQRNLLTDAADDCGTFCVHSYRPAGVLVARGLAQWEDDDKNSDWLNITEAGRLALSEKADGGSDDR